VAYRAHSAIRARTHNEVDWQLVISAASVLKEKPAGGAVMAHHWTAGIALTMSIAHKGAVVGAKAMAASILDLLTSAELRAAPKKQFDEDTKEISIFRCSRRAAAGSQQRNDGKVSSGDAQVPSP
jgi:hypothetical protein